MIDEMEKALFGAMVLMVIGTMGLFGYLMVVETRTVIALIAIIAGSLGGGWVVAELLERFFGINTSWDDERRQ